MHFIILGEGPLHICTSEHFHLHHQTKITTGLTTPCPNLHVHVTDHYIAGVLSETTPISSSKVSIMNRHMGQPWAAIIPIAANLFMEEMETKGISNAPNPSRLWSGYVDNAFVIQQVNHS